MIVCSSIYWQCFLFCEFEFLNNRRPDTVYAAYTHVCFMGLSVWYNQSVSKISYRVIQKEFECCYFSNHKIHWVTQCHQTHHFELFCFLANGYNKANIAIRSVSDPVVKVKFRIRIYRSAINDVWVTRMASWYSVVHLSDVDVQAF